jgi:hypothetical protein
MHTQMKRRHFIHRALGLGLAWRSMQGITASHSPGPWTTKHPAGLARPVFMYNNWSAYDELSDNVPLTEALAMRELAELVRLKKKGVLIDYYVMDAFWFDKFGGYRKWNSQHWPQGPNQWLDTCKANGILPGMWFSTNLIATQSGRFLEPVPEWKDSVATDPNIMCLFAGGYLKHLAETLQIWADRGVRLFKFDFAYFSAATETAKQVHLPSEIEEMNKLAFMDMLKQFKFRNPDILLTGYNGFGGDMEDTVTPFRKSVDIRWLEVFDSLYCGDPRISDVPAMNIWRSQDIYSDHMVRQFAFNGLPLQRIDNCAFMIGKTGTCYSRATQAWKGMLILELARGGWANVYHGNLELLTDADAEWFAKTQKLFHRLQRFGMEGYFGAIPGNAKPYGFKTEAINGTVCTIVNPLQAVATVELPIEDPSKSRILYQDGGFQPMLNGRQLLIGPEQLVVAAFGQFADPEFDLGIDESVQIPLSIEPVEAHFSLNGKNQITAQVNGTPGKDLRIIFQQFGDDGLARRSWGGGPPDGKKMDEFLKIRAMQEKKELPLVLHYDKVIWSGLSWAAAEIRSSAYDPRLPVEIQCSSFESEKRNLKAQVYAVVYGWRQQP